MDAFIIIGVLLVVAIGVHEYRLRRLSDRARRDGKDIADYAATGAFLGLGASGLHDRPHDQAGPANHGDSMDAGGDMGGGPMGE